LSEPKECREGSDGTGVMSFGLVKVIGARVIASSPQILLVGEPRPGGGYIRGRNVLEK